MKGFKIPLRYAKLSVASELKAVNFYLVIVIVFFFIQYCYGGVAGFLQTNQDHMNIFELYIFFLSTRATQTIYLMGIIFLSCGALFYSSGAAYYLIRADRKKWIVGQCLYLFCMNVCYHLFLILCFCFASGGHLTFKNEWSYAAVMASQFSAGSIKIKPTVDISYGMLQVKPISAGIMTIALVVLVGMAVGMIMIFFYSRSKSPIGIAFVLALWFFDILVNDIPNFSKLKYVSPFGLSRISGLSVTGSGPSFFYAAAFLAALCAVLIYILLKTTSKIDFIKME